MQLQSSMDFLQLSLEFALLLANQNRPLNKLSPQRPAEISLGISSMLDTIR